MVPGAWPTRCALLAAATAICFLAPQCRCTTGQPFRGSTRMARLSINEMTTYRWSFEEDVVELQAAGIPAIGVWRQKVADVGEDRAVDLLAQSGLAVSNLLWGRRISSWGADWRAIRLGLESFRGLSLCLELVHQCRQWTIIDDFAHLPSEISAGLGLRLAEWYPGRRVWRTFSATSGLARPSCWTNCPPVCKMRIKCWWPKYFRACERAEKPVSAGGRPVCGRGPPRCRRRAAGGRYGDSAPAARGL